MMADAAFAVRPRGGARPEGRALIAWNLRRIRVSQGVSQARLAALSGVDLSYLSGLERGRYNPTIDMLDKLTRALSAPLQALFLEAGVEAGVAPSLKRGRRPSI